ncbi:MAG: hypothetical protein ACRC57_07150 [Sarcina sp.]
MKKGTKIFIGIIIFIVVVIALLIGIYYTQISPSVDTTPINNAQVNVNEIAKKFIPQDIDISLNGISAKSNVQLSSKELTDMAAYAISKSPSAAKYVEGIKVEPNGNNLVLYITAAYKGIPAQAKVVFSVQSVNGNGVLKYDYGNVGFISIPKSIIFNNLDSNEYISINKQDGSITINTDKLKGIKIGNMSINGSNLEIDLDGKINFPLKN